MCYFWRMKRKSTKSVCQKLAWSCKKWISAKIQYMPFLHKALQLVVNWNADWVLLECPSSVRYWHYLLNPLVKKKSLVYWSLRIVHFTFDWSVYSWLLWWSGHNCKWFCWLYSQNMEIVFWTVPTDQIWTLRLGDKGMLSPSPLLSISCLKGLQNLGRGLLYGKVSNADCPA